MIEIVLLTYVVSGTIIAYAAVKLVCLTTLRAEMKRREAEKRHDRDGAA